MTLRQARVKFSRYLAELVLYGFGLGYEIAFDEVTERMTARDRESDHMAGSLHHMGLAADLLLYLQDGTYLTQTEDYVVLGSFWESLDPLCKWGGKFGDGNHFSYAPTELVGNRK